MAEGTDDSIPKIPNKVRNIRRAEKQREIWYSWYWLDLFEQEHPARVHEMAHPASAARLCASRARAEMHQPQPPPLAKAKA